MTISGAEIEHVPFGWPVRMRMEQRLLSALFRWPTIVDLRPECFMVPTHAALFDALQEAQRTWPVEPLEDSWRWHAYDDATAIIVTEFLRRDELLYLFTHVGGAQTYLVDSLFKIVISPRAIPELVEQIRVCVRCGH